LGDSCELSADEEASDMTPADVVWSEGKVISGFRTPVDDPPRYLGGDFNCTPTRPGPHIRVYF
jgi:hypothetical protein